MISYKSKPIKTINGNSVIYRIVCWRCRQTGTLYKVGKDDYVCTGCKAQGYTTPVIGNSSKIKLSLTGKLDKYAVSSTQS